MRTIRPSCARRGFLASSVECARTSAQFVLAGLLIAAFTGVVPHLAAAQGFTTTIGPQFDVNRPDGRAPAGVLGSHMLRLGEIETRVDLATIDANGLLAGALPFSVDEALDLYPEVPALMSGMSTGLTVLYGVSDRITVLGHVRYFQQDLGHLTRSLEAFYTESGGLGDVQVSGLYTLYEKGPYRAHVEGGVSIPTGSIDQVDITPTSFPTEGQLPYLMQTGSGTFDFLPGAAMHVQNDQGSVGAQFRSTFHLGENSRGYKQGDRAMATVWLAPRINQFIGVSARFVYENWASVSGADGSLDENQTPSAVARFTGGSRAEVPFGLNFFMADGTFEGHRISVEASFPVHQDYEGIQLDRGTTMIVSWQKIF